MSDTPKTDEMEYVCDEASGMGSTFNSRKFTAFTRQLERDLTAARARIAELEAQLAEETALRMNEEEPCTPRNRRSSPRSGRLSGRLLRRLGRRPIEGSTSTCPPSPPPAQPSPMRTERRLGCDEQKRRTLAPPVTL